MIHIGCFIVIQANEKYEGKYRYYLLGHLDRTKRHKHEGDIVFPNDIVGYVGNTGHCKSGGIDMNGDYDSPEERKAREDGRHIYIYQFLRGNKLKIFIMIKKIHIHILKN